MNHRRHNLLSIGGFASAVQLSNKALRLYEQLDLLKPSYVDPETGYRYYHADQLPRARLIRMMRQMDMPLATIRQALAATPAEAETLVRDYWQERERRLALARRMLGSLIASLRQEPMMTIEVNLRTIAPQPVISKTSRIKVEQIDMCIRESLGQLFALAKQHGGAAGAPLGIYHGPINHDDDGPIEVCLPVQQPSAANGEVVARELPGGTAACVMLHGDQCAFPAILQGYDTVFDWIRQNGYEPAESPREIWHSAPGEGARMEVLCLIRKAGA
jgi:DNA-binding transcriptional MerR regulator